VTLHGPSLGIGAGITAAVIVAFFFGMGIAGQEKELVLVETEVPNTPSQELGLSIFTENGSPYLGDPNAPITLVEFGDYQCFFCRSMKKHK